MIEADTMLRFHPWQDPLLEGKGAPFDSVYVERFWLPVIGSTQLCMLRAIGSVVHNRGSWKVNASELSQRLGLGVPTGSPNRPFPRAIKRLCDFGIMQGTQHSDTYNVRLTLGMVPRRYRLRYPPSLAGLHAQIISASEAAAS